MTFYVAVAIETLMVLCCNGNQVGGNRAGYFGGKAGSAAGFACRSRFYCAVARCSRTRIAGESVHRIYHDVYGSAFGSKTLTLRSQVHDIFEEISAS